MTKNCTLVVNGQNVCPSAYTGDLSAANTLAAVSTVAFVAAGVGVGVLVTGLLLPRRHHAERGTVAIYPVLTPASVGLAGTFE